MTPKKPKVFLMMHSNKDQCCQAKFIRRNATGLNIYMHNAHIIKHYVKEGGVFATWCLSKTKFSIILPIISNFLHNLLHNFTFLHNSPHKLPKLVATTNVAVLLACYFLTKFFVYFVEVLWLPNIENSPNQIYNT